MMRWILLSFAAAVVWGCPKDVMTGVRECMGPLEMYAVDQGSILELMSRMDKTSQLCTDGKIQLAFSCLSDLYNRCARSWSSTRRWDLIVDVGKWSEAMNTICSNIQYFRDNAECERKASLEYMPCAEAELEKVTPKMFSVWAEMTDPELGSDDQKIEAVVRIGCSFSVKILDCLRKPFDKFCPKQMTNLLVNMFENFMPPACAKRMATSSSRGSPYYSISGGDGDRDVDIDNSKASKHNSRIQESEYETQRGKTKGKGGKKEAIESSKSSLSDGNSSWSKYKNVSLNVVFVLAIFSLFQRM